MKQIFPGQGLGRRTFPENGFDEQTFPGRVLRGALGEIKNWQEIASLEDANIHGVIDAPEGFRAWALKNGAVEMAPEEWAAFRGNGYKR
uniref:Uncharacterized protein n=1 Tax=Candidatus Kentrum sp. LPFa TaxID=2126335 RepID=A0A450WT26_9GAMM|nr:MAG: hypothetical protein BECKLPF1236A_GA0070988_102522 [Candidatus Kentron sp. LPFa]VFK34651.1 MAG: hypothetical protein BECKLPF1236C_GA0070990_102881 [Candidatus Kentron sp. LPFa]